MSIVHATSAQTTFNQVFYYSEPCVGTNVICLGNEFIILGISLNITDSISYYQQFIRFIDNDGNHLNSTLLGNDSTQYLNFADNNYIFDNNHFLIGTTKYVNGIMNGTLKWIENTGEIVQERDFLSPYFNENEIDNTQWMYPRDISKSENGFIYMASQIGTPETGNDFCILKLTPEGDEIWTYIYATEADPDLCYALEATDDGGVLVAAGSSAPLTEELAIKHFFKLDGGGEMEWEFTLDGFISGYAKDFILEDNAIVVVTESVNSAQTAIKPYVYKIDTLGEFIWDTEVEGAYHEDQWAELIVATQDGGYVIAAQNYETWPENQDVNGQYNWNGWLVKLDNDGEIVWDRKYHHVESTQDDHAIYDLKATSDGGYIFCGEATDHDPDNIEEGIPIQQAWLVKVDGCGCLVPGCDPNCTTGVEEATIDYESTHFLAGPNPASQFINIHVLDEGFSQDRQVRIFDLQGKVVKEFSAQQGGVTYMTDVEGLSSGVYLVSLFVGGELVQSERIVKE